ncbi:2-dehydropantoate 2-reductase [Maricurvus nonylphenolicus]|uniref:2-dehydropantoate 2-reductase n=1 Tax=Maricurvus nonylphenolicus TaxID=1008307 RepID=UPI0036F2F50E
MTAHVVFGAGLIGGYLGGALMAQGQEVGWVVRPATREKLDQGLLITDYAQHRQKLEILHFIDPQAGGESAEVLWLTVKCTALAAALENMAPLVGPNTIIICLQNGLGAESQVQAAFPCNQVIRGVLSANVAELKPGHLHLATEGGIDLPALPETAPLETLSSELLTFTLHHDIEAMLWAKLHLNLNNAINAISGIPLKEQLAQRGYRRVLAAAMRELMKVAKAKQIKLLKLTRLPPSLLPPLMSSPDWVFTRVANQMLAIDPEARSSMWVDLSEGRKTEIDFLNGAIVEEGERLGIACPVNKKLQQLVRSIEVGEISQGISSNELLHRVEE